jgi:hypothetical protein
MKRCELHETEDVGGMSAPVRRRQIAYVCQRGRSLRRACALLNVARSTARSESRLEARDAPIVAAMRELAAQYPRHGYRRIQVFLARRRSGEQLDLDCANGDVVRDLPLLRA